MHSWSSPPMWSMGSGVRGEELKTLTNYYTPGPGNYDQINPETTKDAYPSWKVGTSKRPNLYGSSNADVGPGSYETVNKTNEKKYDKKTFPRDKRGHSEFKGISTVGPDAYHPKRTGKAPPAFSFGYKTDGFTEAHKSDVPGPGAYEIKDGIQETGEKDTAFNRTAPQNLTKSRQPVFGSSDLPGPGTHFNGPDNERRENYDFRYFQPTWSFGRSNRDDLYNETRQVPGPGKYQISGTINTKTGFTILGKNEKNEAKANSGATPGPNVYNQDIAPLRKTAPSFRVGKAERKDMSTGNPEFPGPGAYHKDEEILAEKGTRIGSSQRKGLYGSEKTPGPGEYEVRGDVTKGVKYSMGAKCGPKKAGEVYPGPGEYEPFGSIYLEKNNGAIIGTSERPTLYKKATVPGPGQYDTRGNLGGTRSTFGTGKRQPMAKANDEPGPGFYNIPSAIGNVQKYQVPSYVQERKRAVSTDKETSFRGIFGGKSD